MESEQTLEIRQLLRQVLKKIAFDSGKQITITGNQGRIDEIDKIRTVDNMWSEVLDYDLIVGELVDVVLRQ